jgi:hypothetical protein
MKRYVTLLTISLLSTISISKAMEQKEEETNPPGKTTAQDTKEARVSPLPKKKLSPSGLRISSKPRTLNSLDGLPSSQKDREVGSLNMEIEGDGKKFESNLQTINE